MGEAHPTAYSSLGDRFQTTEQVGRDKAGEGTGKEEIQTRQQNSILAALPSALVNDFQSAEGLGLV